jgi:hypothetical protein
VAVIEEEEAASAEAVAAIEEEEAEAVEAEAVK